MITRRGFIGTAAAALTWLASLWRTKAEPAKRDRPWSHLRNEEKEGPYCDYGAWESWMSQQLDKPGNVMQDAFGVFDSSSVLERIGLYSVMCGVADGTYPPQPGANRER